MHTRASSKAEDSVNAAVFKRTSVLRAVEFLEGDMFRLGVASKSWKTDDQQGGEHVPGGASCQLHGQLQPVVGL